MHSYHSRKVPEALTLIKMIFLILSFLIASVGFTYEFETMAKFESAYAIIRRINFQTIDDVTKCISLENQFIHSLWSL